MGICRRQFGAALAAGLAAGRLGAFAVRPKLIVLVIIEQLRPDYLDSISRQLAPAGFRRLLEKGAYFPDCRHLASTFPATCVATLATGTWPAQHGIIADNWLDPATRKPVAGTDELLLGTTLASQIIGELRSSRVYVVGMQESHANLFAGGADARIYWMDDSGQFVTSGETSDWLTAYNTQHPPDGFRNVKWTALNAGSTAPALRTLTWSPERPGEFMTLYKSSPYGQEMLFDFAGKLIQKETMGQGSTVDFLCILAGSSELLGYDTGARSPLMLQLMLQLDRRIEALLAQLSKAPGEAAFNLVVAGGHGAPPEPGPDRERTAVKGDSVAEAVNHSLMAASLGRVEKYIYPFLYLDTSGFRDPEPIRRLAGRAALDHPAVAEYFTAGGACSTHSDWQRRFRNSFHSTRSGDVMLSYHSEFVEDYSNGRGVSYGSLYNYDIRVPLLFYGPQFRAAVFENPVESVDVAPTLARAMGVGVPSKSVGRVLGEALLE